MKKISLFVLLLIISSFLEAQNLPSKKLSYQAAVYNSFNTLARDRMVKVKISLLGSINGSAAYIEEHQVKTSLNGIMTLQIG